MVAKKTTQNLYVSVELIERKIYFIRGLKVMIDSDLAKLYQIETRVFNQTVKRNRSRFSEDLMFQLTKEEVESLKSQIATLNKGRGGRRYLPFAFTKQGIAMLSGVLNGEQANEINTIIMQTFMQFRRTMISKGA